MTEELAKILAENIKKGRKALRISQALLAEKAGLSTAHLAMIELGNRNPSLESLEAIAIALNVQTYELLMPENAEQSSPSVQTVYQIQNEITKQVNEVFDRILNEKKENS